MAVTRTIFTPNVTDATESGIPNKPGSLFFNTDDDVLKYKNNAGTIKTVADTGGFVPYTGATTNVDLGAHNLTATALNANTAFLNELDVIGSGSVAAFVTTTTTGSSNSADFYFQRGDQANGFCGGRLYTSSTEKWRYGMRPGSDNFNFYDATNSTVVFNITQGSGTSSVATFTGMVVANAFTGTASAASTVSTANEAADTSCFLAFFTASGTQTLQPKNNTGLTYDSSNNVMGASGLNLSGLTASQAVVTDGSKNLSSLAYASANTASALVQRDGSGNFSAGTITASLTGTASTATVANTVSSANEATDTSCFPLFITASGTQSLQPKNNANLTYDSNTGLFGSTNFNVSGASASSIISLDSNKNITSTTGTTASITIGDGTNNFTTSTASFRYYQMGPLIVGTGVLVWSSKGSAASGSNIRISLPAAIGANWIRIAVSIGFVSGVSFTGSQLNGVGSNGNSFINLYGLANTGSSTAVTVSQFSASGELHFELFYGTN